MFLRFVLLHLDVLCVRKPLVDLLICQPRTTIACCACAALDVCCRSLPRVVSAGQFQSPSARGCCRSKDTGTYNRGFFAVF